MKHSIARVISTVFQPLLMPTYGVMLLFVYTYFGVMYSHRFWLIVAPVFLFSFLIPAILIGLLYRMGLVSDLSIKVRRQRFIPYVITLVSYGLMAILYYRMQMPTWFLMMIAAPIAIVIIATMITLAWKISAHMFGIGGLIGGAMSVSYFVENTNPYYMFMALFVLAGLIGSSRLILKHHSLSQVNAGFLLGFTITFVFVWMGAK
ncbi:MAG: hypothetical protein QM237_07385 [Bacteroidota bacterium]|jgi:membrane-associated phospholipid phosphatase|nr:hypothetical protein [Bacteroidota bacterium]HHU97942.1 phosphatase PAP2 family protein [Petrimonas sp.]